MCVSGIGWNYCSAAASCHSASCSLHSAHLVKKKIVMKDTPAMPSTFSRSLQGKEQQGKACSVQVPTFRSCGEALLRCRAYLSCRPQSTTGCVRMNSM